MRIIVRGYGDGKLVLQERVELTRPEDLQPIAERQLKTIAAYELHMVEIEFLDEPDPLQRFIRFGTDGPRMVQPHAIGDTPSSSSCR